MLLIVFIRKLVRYRFGEMDTMIVVKMKKEEIFLKIKMFLQIFLKIFLKIVAFSKRSNVRKCSKPF